MPKNSAQTDDTSAPQEQANHESNVLSLHKRAWKSRSQTERDSLAKKVAPTYLVSTCPVFG